MTREEYDKKFAANMRVSGFGIETTVHFPCPFCAEPDFIVTKVIDVESSMATGAVCHTCGRGTRTIFHREEHSTAFEVVQTCGADPPAYLPPLRRIGTKPS